jgi:hypothetical protein
VRPRCCTQRRTPDDPSRFVILRPHAVVVHHAAIAEGSASRLRHTRQICVTVVDERPKHEADPSAIAARCETAAWGLRMTRRCAAPPTAMDPRARVTCTRDVLAMLYVGSTIDPSTSLGIEDCTIDPSASLRITRSALRALRSQLHRHHRIQPGRVAGRKVAGHEPDQSQSHGGERGHERGELRLADVFVQ